MFGNKCSIADVALDLFGGFGPGKGLGTFIPVGQEADDGAFKVGHAGETATTNRLLADESEPALSQI
jgi:hypothetical protein